MATKVCFICKQEKDTSCFRGNKKNKDGLNGNCRDYCNEYAREYRQKHLAECREKDRIRNKTPKAIEARKKYQETLLYKETQRRFREKPESRLKMHIYTTSQEYRDRINKKRRDNIDKMRGKELVYNRKRRQIPEVRIKSALRSRLNGLIKRGKGSKSCKMVELVGCTMPFLRQYLESLWTEGMTWDNYGHGRGHWVIDHIIACAKFNLKDREEQKQCFNYKNLQPLWWEENASKSDN